MLILLDLCAPGPMRAYLPGHIVHTAAEMGWDLRPDGEVLTLAEAHGYELLISVDQDIQYQQNLTVRQIAILVLKPNDWSLIRPRIDDINAAISRENTSRLISPCRRSSLTSASRAIGNRPTMYAIGES